MLFSFVFVSATNSTVLILSSDGNWQKKTLPEKKNEKKLELG